MIDYPELAAVFCLGAFVGFLPTLHSLLSKHSGKKIMERQMLGFGATPSTFYTWWNKPIALPRKTSLKSVEKPFNVNDRGEGVSRLQYAMMLGKQHLLTKEDGYLDTKEALEDMDRNPHKYFLNRVSPLTRGWAEADARANEILSKAGLVGMGSHDLGERK